MEIVMPFIRWALRLLWEALRYSLVGTGGNVIYLASYYALTEYWELWYIAAAVIGLSLSTILTFRYQRSWTFENKERERTERQLVLYSVVRLLFIGINIVCLYLLVQYLRLGDKEALVIVMIALGVPSFFINKEILRKPRAVSTPTTIFTASRTIWPTDRL